ncbi:MAG: hypothetical protein QE509_07910 [Gammaproteobacteria bacterium]|nr:hypothetical protein [Gammaproteobacteria bacterium]
MENPYDQFDKPRPTLRERDIEAGITQSGAAAAASRLSAEIAKNKERRDALKAQRRRATPEQVKAQGLDPTISYQIDGLGELYLNPGQPPAKAKIVDPSRLPGLRSTLTELEKAEKMARDSFLTVGRPAEIITSLPLIGGLLDQPRVDFEATNESIKARLMQDTVAKLAQINQGGVTGMANTPTEAQRMAASIANLDPNQSRGQFLSQAQRVRDYLAREMAELEGKYPAKIAGSRITPEQARAELARRRALRGTK